MQQTQKKTQNQAVLWQTVYSEKVRRQTLEEGSCSSNCYWV